MLEEPNLRILGELNQVYRESAASIVVRHAKREKPNKVFLDSGHQLTKEGVEAARTFGKGLRPFAPFRFFSSPVDRCKATARAIMEGIGIECPISESPLLGRHGPFVLDSTRMSQRIEELGEDLIESWFSGKLERGILRTPREGTNLLVRWLIERRNETTKGLDVHVSHDLIVTPVIATSLDYDILGEGLIGFLDGFILLKQDEDNYEIVFRGRKKSIRRDELK